MDLNKNQLALERMDIPFHRHMNYKKWKACVSIIYESAISIKKWIERHVMKKRVIIKPTKVRKVIYHFH